MDRAELESLEDLVSEMAWFQAIRSIRELVGGSSKEAGYKARQIVGRRPSSALAKSYLAQPPDSPSRRLFG